MLYIAIDKFESVEYTYCDWRENIGDRKSTSIVFQIGSGTISWVSKKQPIVSFSTEESEYVAENTAAC